MKRMLWMCMVLTVLLSSCAGPQMTVAEQWQEQYDLGVRYLEEGNYEEAIIAFSAAIEIDPKRAEAYVGRGDAYVLSGETEENLAAAQTDYEEAIELDETNANAYLGLADICIRRGDFDGALAVILRGLEHCPDDANLMAKKAELDAGEVTDSTNQLRRTSSYDAQGNLTWYRTYAYSRDGKYSSVASFDSAGNQTGYVEFTYDANGNALHGESGYTLDTGVPIVADWTYDENGEVTGVTEYAADGTVSTKGVYQWASNRQERIYTQYNSSGDLLCQCVTSYDERGKCLSISWRDPKGVAYSTGVYEYDSAGNVSKLVWSGEDGKVTETWVYSYNAQGEEISMDVYDAEGNRLQSTTGER